MGPGLHVIPCTLGCLGHGFSFTWFFWLGGNKRFSIGSRTRRNSSFYGLCATAARSYVFGSPDRRIDLPLLVHRCWANCGCNAGTSVRCNLDVHTTWVPAQGTTRNRGTTL